MNSPNELKKTLLAAEYEEAAKEADQIKQELEGALSDGLTLPKDVYPNYWEPVPCPKSLA